MDRIDFEIERAKEKAKIEDMEIICNVILGLICLGIIILMC